MASYLGMVGSDDDDEREGERGESDRLQKSYRYLRENTKQTVSE